MIYKILKGKLLHYTVHDEYFISVIIYCKFFQWDDRGSEQSSCDRSPRQSPAWLPIQTVVHLSKLVTGSVLRVLLHFLYTGTIFCRECQLPSVDLSELKQAAEFLELPELQMYTSNLMKKEEFLNNDLSQQYLQVSF